MSACVTEVYGDPENNRNVKYVQLNVFLIENIFSL